MPEGGCPGLFRSCSLGRLFALSPGGKGLGEECWPRCFPRGGRELRHFPLPFPETLLNVHI
jgi:hypothetical protein